MYGNRFAVTDTESLRMLCIENSWFTDGSNSQYLKMFDCNTRPDAFSLRDIGMFIYANSDGELSDILDRLVEARAKYREREKPVAGEEAGKENREEAIPEKKEPFGGLNVGDRAKVYMKFYDGSIPLWLDGCSVTVVGFTKNGNVKCDYDGGKPFYINPGMLEKTGEKREMLKTGPKRHTSR